ncbi:hypothetical protein RAS14_31015 [Achromobacter aegrifaciens]|uniref:hypothetical protein n=1 Tax=Achromobacter TaxID=222 RepID=UPI0012668FEA|nr:MULTISPECIES: hypothetical protein [Achromobacter]MDQ1764231.1 hypothetical protein [Achromobacter aegrifaciens]
MAKKATELVGTNVDQLMRTAGLSNAALEKKTNGRLTRSTVDRVRRAQGSAGVESVAEIARAFGLDLWQLFVEDLDPAHLPSLMTEPVAGTLPLSKEEQTLLECFRTLNPAFQQLILNDIERYSEAERQTLAKKGESPKRRA